MESRASFFWLFILAFTHAGCEEVRVETSTGALIGRFDGTLTRFQGIPYASPPVGRLRFAPPEPKPKWTGQRQATTAGNACVQDLELQAYQEAMFPGLGRFITINTTSEDCLYLDVVLYGKLESNTARRPVMVWIHGGAFVMGSGSSWSGDAIAKTADVVYVAVNYRLGLFGYLSTGGDGPLPGNQALRDLQLALGWVHDNIGEFGGDAGRVTVFGESAGASMTLALTLSPGSAGLFHRVIIQSAGYAMNSKATGRQILSLIRPDRIYSEDPQAYGAIPAPIVHRGTDHISVIDNDELFVSLTTSLNYLFGSGIVTSDGIILNNNMADFGSGLNKVDRGKRPQSSQSPIISEAILKCARRTSIGGTNGTRIISGVALTLSRLLGFNQNLHEAIDMPRLHNQLYDDQGNPDTTVEWEEHFPKEIRRQLATKGHKFADSPSLAINAVNAVMKENETLTAEADYRKGGKPSIY